MQGIDKILYSLDMLGVYIILSITCIHRSTSSTVESLIEDFFSKSWSRSELSMISNY